MPHSQLETLPISYFIGQATLDDVGKQIASDRVVSNATTNPFAIPANFGVLSMRVSADVDIKYSDTGKATFKTLAAGAEKVFDLVDGDRKIWLKKATSGNAVITIEFSGDNRADA